MARFWNRMPGSAAAWPLGALLAGLPLAAPASAQDERSLEETIRSLTGDAAAAYVAPISSAFGANLNSGWFRRAPKAKKLGFDFSAGFVAMGSVFPDDADHFEVSGRFRFSAEEAGLLVDRIAPAPSDPSYLNWETVRQALIAQITSQSGMVDFSGATVIGAATDSVTVRYPGETYDVGGLAYAVPAAEVKLPFGGSKDLADVGMLPLVVPQFSVGTLFGTRLTLRFLPSLQLNRDLGPYTYTGFGLQHNPAVWIGRDLPVDLGLSYYAQTLRIGTLFDSRSSAWGVTASKQLGWRFLNATPYFGLLFEDTEMDVHYDLAVRIEDEEGNAVDYSEAIDISLPSVNSTRTTFGLNLRLGIVNLNADYSLAAYDSFSAGLSVAF